MKGAPVITVMLAVALAEKMCNEGSDCGDNECCMKDTKPYATCEPLPDSGDSCLPHPPEDIVGKGTYLFGCPCANGLECWGKVATNENRIILLKDARCVEPDVPLWNSMDKRKV